jgi:hypothetical protein
VRAIPGLLIRQNFISEPAETLILQRESVASREAIEIAKYFLGRRNAWGITNSQIHNGEIQREDNSQDLAARVPLPAWDTAFGEVHTI